MDFGTLKARLLSQIGRAPDDLCYELVTADINQSLRLTDMLSKRTLEPPYVLPDDFRQVQVALVGDRVLRPSTEASLNRGVTQGACEYSITGTNLVPDSDGEDITIKYYAALPDLADDSDTNAILTRYPSIYVYGTLAHHAGLIKDQLGISVHFPAYDRLMASTQREDNRKRIAGAPMAIKARASA